MILMSTGRIARPLLAPLALRTTPLERSARIALLVGVAGVVAAGSLCLRARRTADARAAGCKAGRRWIAEQLDTH
jgi:hypothetical protein